MILSQHKKFLYELQHDTNNISNFLETQALLRYKVEKVFCDRPS